MDTALFSPSSLFHHEDDEDDDDDCIINTEGEDEGEGEGEGEGIASLSLIEEESRYVERTHSFPGLELNIREFAFHQLNANLLWPGTFAFSEWLVENHSILDKHRILELGSGTGALAIFLRRSFGVDITSSDFDDKEVEENIAYNCKANELAVLPHIRHSWGDVFPTAEPDWDVIIASDILLYVKQYPKLIKTLCFLLNSYKAKAKAAIAGSSQLQKTVTISGKQIELQLPFFLMSWRRRIGKDDKLFFSGCENAGLSVNHLGSRVYYITPTRL